MLATEWSSDHTCNTEVVLIEFAGFEKLIYYGLLLIPATRFRNVARISRHSHEVEVSTSGDEAAKGKVQKGIRGKSPSSTLACVSLGLLIDSQGRIFVSQRTQTQRRVPAKTPARKGCA